MSKGLSGKADWHKFFEFNCAKNETKCKLCEKVFSQCNESNLKRHLNSVHKDEATKSKASVKRQLPPDEDSVAAKKRKLTKSTFIQYALSTLVIELRPFCIFDSKSFIRGLIYDNEVKFGVTMNPENMKQYMKLCAEEMRAIIVQETRGNYISVKADVATRQHRSFLGINIQFFSLLKKRIVLRTIGNNLVEKNHE